MKKPEEIKKGLECCAKGNACRGHCPYDGRSAGIKECTSQLARDALTLIPRWIPVEERIPDNGEDCALYVRCGDVSFVRTGWRMKNGQFICPSDSLSGYEVTHWMPLPEPPEEVEKNAD